MANLYDIPRSLVHPRYSFVRLLGTEFLIERLDGWKRLVVAEYGGDPAGYLIANSCYRPKSDLTSGLEPGITEHDYQVDFTDANGHWTGCAVDYSARLTADSFWHDLKSKNEFGVKAAFQWRRDDIRDSLVTAGLYHPWYWKQGVVGGAVHEYWHAAVEMIPWTQKRAYRGVPPHWYDGLRPGSTAIRTH